jgi:hypothetical protein
MVGLSVDQPDLVVATSRSCSGRYTPMVGDNRINGWWTAEEALRRHPDLVGAVLVWREYQRPSEAWDHDHCALCWATITDMANPSRDDLGAAFTDDVSRPASPPLSDPKLVPAPAGTKSWICSVCAKAFQPVFRWTLNGGPD